MVLVFWAAITKCYRLEGVNNGHFLFWKLHIQDRGVSGVGFFLRFLSLARRGLSSHCVLTWSSVGLSVCHSPLIRTIDIRTYPSDLFKGPMSTLSHAEVPEMRTSTHEFSGVTVQPKAPKGVVIKARKSAWVLFYILQVFRFCPWSQACHFPD